MSIKPIIGLVLALFVIIATVALFSGLMNMFAGGADEGSIAALKRVVSYANALTHPKNNDNYTYCYFENFYIEPDWALVGFNRNGLASSTTKEVNEVEEYCGPLDDNIEKANICGYPACLCLCFGGSRGDVDGDDCMEDEAVCLKVDKKINRFLSNLDGNNPSDLVIDSESCWGTDKNVQKGFLAQKIDDGSDFKIKITPILSDSQLNNFKQDKDDYARCGDLVKFVEEKDVKEQTLKEPEKLEQKKIDETVKQG